MAHDHHHDGESAGAYFTEQLLTLLVCGLFGLVGVLFYVAHLRDLDAERHALAAEKEQLDKAKDRVGPKEYEERLQSYQVRERQFADGNAKTRLSFLAPDFRPPVLWGGVVILLLVGVRAVAVWREAGELQARAADGMACAADHAHGPDCAHGPGLPGGHAHDHEDHGHSHDLSWAFARMLVLVFPVLLFFLNQPPRGFSKEGQLGMVGNETEVGGLRQVAARGGTVLRFNDLNDAAFDPAKRESMEGQTATLEGRFKKLGDKQFTLFRLKMTCCASDTVPLKVRIVVPQALTGFADFDWVRVRGQIQFVQVPGARPGAETYIPVIEVKDITDVAKAPAQNEYEP